MSKFGHLVYRVGVLRKERAFFFWAFAMISFGLFAAEFTVDTIRIGSDFINDRASNHFVRCVRTSADQAECDDKIFDPYLILKAIEAVNGTKPTLEASDSETDIMKLYEESVGTRVTCDGVEYDGFGTSGGSAGSFGIIASNGFFATYSAMLIVPFSLVSTVFDIASLVSKSTSTRVVRALINVALVQSNLLAYSMYYRFWDRDGVTGVCFATLSGDVDSEAIAAVNIAGVIIMWLFSYGASPLYCFLFCSTGDSKSEDKLSCMDVFFICVMLIYSGAGLAALVLAIVAWEMEFYVGNVIFISARILHIGIILGAYYFVRSTKAMSLTAKELAKTPAIKSTAGAAKTAGAVGSTAVKTSKVKVGATSKSRGADVEGGDYSTYDDSDYYNDDGGYYDDDDNDYYEYY